MADLLSNISTSGASGTQSELLVEAFRKSKEPEVDLLKGKKTTLETRRGYFNTLKSKLNTLLSQVDKFTSSDANKNFITRNISSSDSDVVTATADDESILGINSVKVNRLASSDLLVSKRLTNSDLFAVNGTDLTFKINGKDVKVTINAGTTNENAIKAIASAINAVDDININASFIKDTSTTGRLTLTSSETGAENKITFDDNASGVLNALGFDNVNSGASNRTQIVSDSTLAYYKTTNVDQLDASLEVNGIQITRGENTIDDILNGVTLNLLKPQDTADSAVTLTTSVNVSGVENLVNPLINAYNDVVLYLKNNVSLLRNESSVNNLYSTLRGLSSESVSSADIGNPKYLTEMGIKINNDGTLSIKDRTALTDLLKDDPSKVSELFTGADGFASKIEDAITNLIGNDGIIMARTKSIGSQIDTTAKKITSLEDKINRQAESLRNEYESMLRVMLEAQSQYSYLFTNYSNTNG